MSKRNASGGGAPRKARSGLTRALFIRVDEQTVERLETLRTKLSNERGVTFSGADVVRLVLTEAFELRGVGGDHA